MPTLLIGAGGALLFWLIGFPAAILTGPAAAVSLASVLGFRSHIPGRVRDAVFLVIGVSIGSTVTPEVIETALAWPLSLGVFMITLVVTILVVRVMLRRVFAFDPMTALLCAAPGHLSYVMGLSVDMKVDVTRVALVQSVRVLLLTLLVPVILVFWGAEGTAYMRTYGMIGVGPAVAVFGLALVLGLVFKRLSVPAPLLLGAMTVSAIGHGSDLTPGSLPDWLTVAAFVVMGSLIGTRFRGLTRAQLFGALGAGVATTLVACLLAAAGALIAGRIVDMPPAALLLAFAPGGVEVMAALAVETGLEPAFVAACHVFRLALLSILLPLFLVDLKRRRRP
ncbi:hypothetical protein GCM10011316_17260 [Roseibium aquae]|uniref:AbrB family transcriptional regulator n=1 Tax=Roseibium aquae TaxID=1323746 RepID=A0A916TIB9_9HYPH|nr:hypothetical protein GCM10011316_17260 [Roseibium aquae]